MIFGRPGSQTKLRLKAGEFLQIATKIKPPLAEADGGFGKCHARRTGLGFRGLIVSLRPTF